MKKLLLAIASIALVGTAAAQTGAPASSAHPSVLPAQPAVTAKDKAADIKAAPAVKEEAKKDVPAAGAQEKEGKAPAKVSEAKHEKNVAKTKASMASAEQSKADATAPAAKATSGGGAEATKKQ